MFHKNVITISYYRNLNYVMLHFVRNSFIRLAYSSHTSFSVYLFFMDKICKSVNITTLIENAIYKQL